MAASSERRLPTLRGPHAGSAQLAGLWRCPIALHPMPKLCANRRAAWAPLPAASRMAHAGSWPLAAAAAPDCSWALLSLAGRARGAAGASSAPPPGIPGSRRLLTMVLLGLAPLRRQRGRGRPHPAVQWHGLLPLLRSRMRHRGGACGAPFSSIAATQGRFVDWRARAGPGALPACRNAR